MSIGINALAELSTVGGQKANSADDGFKQAVEDAINGKNSAYNSIYLNQKSYVAISPKLEEKMKNDPELAREIAEKIENFTNVFGCGRSDHMVIVDRRGEITQYCTKRDKCAEKREYESIKEAAKARLRKKARLDDYFKLVQKMSIKRKLIEQENAKRPRGKLYRSSGTKLESIAKSILMRTDKTLSI